MDLTHPERTLAPTLDLPVLACLGRQDRAWTTRELADATGATIPGVRQALRRLSTSGLVHESQLGQIRGYRFNRSHVMASALLEIADAPAVLRHRITSGISDWVIPARLVLLFGSWARGESDDQSDVDLLVLHSDDLTSSEQDTWEEQVESLKEDVLSWSGNSCDVLSFSLADWTEHRRRDDPISRAVDSDAIVLSGRRSLLNRHGSPVGATRS